MKTQPIKIARSYGGTRTVQGVPIAGTPFAVRREVKKKIARWTLTHLPSGLLVCFGRSFSHGQAIARVLAAVQTDWTNLEAIRRDIDAVRRTIEFVGGSRDW